MRTGTRIPTSSSAGLPSGAAFRAFLTDGLRGLGLSLSPDQAILLDRFRGMLLQANRTRNLTALESDYEVAVKHVLDSLTCLRLGLFDGPSRVVDIGSGAGFPGIPLKIARPELQVTLLDSSEKRTAFLRETVAGLGLEDCEVVRERAEVFARQPGRRDGYDVAVVRAVAHLAVDLEYAVPLLEVGGRLVAMKGPKAAAEMAEAGQAAEMLGAAHERTLPLSLPLAGESRFLVVFRKTGATPDAYPRREGQPAKRPLGSSASTPR